MANMVKYMQYASRIEATNYQVKSDDTGIVMRLPMMVTLPVDYCKEVSTFFCDEVRTYAESILLDLKTKFVSDQNRHILCILACHFTYQSSINVMHIDMQRCDFTLQDYIEFHRNDHNLLSVYDKPSADDVLITKDAPSLAIAKTICVVANHIASGLEDMHANDMIHRALPPDHGT